MQSLSDGCGKISKPKTDEAPLPIRARMMWICERSRHARQPSAHPPLVCTPGAREKMRARDTRGGAGDALAWAGANCCTQAFCPSVIGLATFGEEKIANQLAITTGYVWLHPEIVERLRKSNPHNCGFQMSGSLVDHLAFLFSFIDFISQR